MDDKRDAITIRTRRLFQSVLTTNSLMQKPTGQVKIGYDALLDSLVALFDECSKDGLKSDIAVSYFVNKYKYLISEIKSLRVNINDFELKHVVGRGYSGEVSVAQEKVTGDHYAIKIIDKSKTLHNVSAALFEEERDILCTATSQWLTKMHYTFQDRTNLYIVMDFESGGDLLSLLEREGGTLSEEHTRFYVAESLLAARSLHAMGYVHRDIRPENLLLDNCGHVKLADFGSAARLSIDGRVTTAMPKTQSAYLAPEIMKEKGRKVSYGVECDIWSIGILAHSLVYGSPPKDKYIRNKFKNNEPLIYSSVIRISESLQDLINRIVEPSATRLDYHGVRNHAFFEDIDFDTLRQAVPPIVPVVSAPDDVSNFTGCYRVSPEGEAHAYEISEFSGKQLPFIGYTYSGFSSESPEPRKNDLECEVLRKENKELLYRLFQAEHNNEEAVEGRGLNHQIQKLTLDKATLQKDLVRERQENERLRKTIEVDRQDRRQVEEKALKIVKNSKLSTDREIKVITNDFQSRIEDLTDRLTLAHTINNELNSQNDRAENEIAALRVDLERYKSDEKILQDKVAKSFEVKRISVSGFESRLDKLQNEHQNKESLLYEKLKAEKEAKDALLRQLNELRGHAAADEQQKFRMCDAMEEELRSLKEKLQSAEAEAVSLRENRIDKSVIDDLQSRLNIEISEKDKLKTKMAILETDLSNTNASFLEHETNEQREHVEQLEQDLKKLSQEKIQLQSILQNTKARDRDNRNKLTDLEKMLESLEKEVYLLEKENAELKVEKHYEDNIPKLTAETETKYEQKIIILNEQISKLEEQVDRLKETAILEKQELRSTNTKLWKAERELSDAKIDIRIAKREAKTAEETCTKLKEELTALKESTRAAEKVSQEALEAEGKKCQDLLADLRSVKEELARLQNVRADAERLAVAEKQLQGDYNTLRQQILTSDRNLASVRAETEVLQMSIQTLTNEKMTLKSTIEEQKSRIERLELNNTVLRDAASTLEEQLMDYENFVTDQTAKIGALDSERLTLSQTVSQIQSELQTNVKALAEEKTKRTSAENRLTQMQNEIDQKTNVIDELNTQLDSFANTNESLSIRLLDKERNYSRLELELQEKERDLESLESEILWLKNETSSQLTSLYSLKEANYKLNHELEEEGRYTEALQERITELEGVITELEAFHRQREVKDDATKQQQNKLISFLQSKLHEDKKKKTLADKLFGNRRREPPSPQTPATASPRALPVSPKSTSGPLKKKVIQQSKNTDSPDARHVANEIVNSPSNRFQRQMSLPRMQHKIPHRFKSQQIKLAAKCAGCNDNIPRGRASVCIHCNVPAHPNCAASAPKTCSLPSALAKHFAKTVDKSTKDNSELNHSEEALKIEGFIDVMSPGDSTWKKHYLKIDGCEVLIFDKKPTEDCTKPCGRWNLVERQTLVSDSVAANELPSVAKSDIPFIIKVVKMSGSTCWPEEKHYLLIRTPSEKPRWIAALQLAATATTSVKSPVTPKIVGLKIIYQENVTNPSLTPFSSINCIEEINEKVQLLGTDAGLFSLKAACDNPVKISGITSVHEMTVAHTINIFLFLCGEGRRLVSADHRLTVSNAEAAACATPGISTDIVELPTEDPICCMAVSPEIDGHVYLSVATSRAITLLRWSPMMSCFTILKNIDTQRACSCFLYHRGNIIVGVENFQSLSILDFTTKEILEDREIKSAFIKLGSYPMYAAAISSKELLLCFREFGLFVDETGEKTRPDLKWPSVPNEFAYCAQYLYILCSSSVEVLRISKDTVPFDDASSIATTATIDDTVSVALNCPQLLGRTGKGIFVSNGSATAGFIEGKKMCPDDFNERRTMNRMNSDGRFSFTSSIISSLDGNDSDDSSDSIKHTAL